MNVWCMIHVRCMILDPWPWRMMYIWCMYPWFIPRLHVSIMHVSMLHVWSLILVHVRIMHVCMMHISVILDSWPDACTYDAYNFYPWALMKHVSMMPKSMNACIHDARIVDACIQDEMHPWCMCPWYIVRIIDVHIYIWCIHLYSLILDPDACIHDTFIYDPWSWCL